KVTHQETRREGLDENYQRLIWNVIEFNTGSPQANAARTAVELNRPGGADPEQVRQAFDDPRLNPAVYPPGSREFKEALAERDKMYRLIDEYAPPAGGVKSPRKTDEIRADVANRLAGAVRNDDLKSK